MRNILMLLMTGILFFTAACTQDNQAKEKEPDQDDTQVEAKEKDEADKHAINQIPDIGETETADDMKNQPGGILISELTLEEELSTETDQIMADIDSELREQLANLASLTDNPQEIEKGLINLLGSPNYQETIESAEAFQPDFEEPYLPTPKRVNESGNSTDEIGKAIILLDASSSMLLSVDGKVKMGIAKDAVKRFADVIGQDSEVSLVVYGHKGSESNSDKKLSCEGIEEIYTLGEYDSQKFEESLSTFESKGWTPLAGAINKASEMSTKIEGAITVYIVSDGVETCDGDPIKAAKDFATTNEDRSVNIIGFNVDKKAEDQLKEVSEAGNGRYFSANNAEEIQETIEYEWLPSLVDLAWAHTKAPGPWEIMAQWDLSEAGYNKIQTLNEKERERFEFSLGIMRDDELLTSEVYEEVDNIIWERYGHKRDIYQDLQSKKRDEIQGIADEIRERVDQWVEEMREYKGL